MLQKLGAGLRSARNALISDVRVSPSKSGGLPALTATDWSSINLIPIMKTNYKVSPLTTNRSDEDIAQFYKTAGLSVDGIEPPKPLLTFEECLCFKPAKATFQVKKFEKPTPIQSVCWPISLSGRDLVGNVRTGSGKTLGFLLPAMLHINSQAPIRPGDGPAALVLVPTRELAEQISILSREFGPSFGVKNVLICGGMSKPNQIDRINRSPQLYIATPGRLIDLMNLGLISFRRMTYLVIDEADRMLDMGFEDQLRNILRQVRPDKQTSMWSATWPKEVHRLSEDFLTDPIIISEQRQEMALNLDIKHDVSLVSPDEKKDLLFETLKSEPIGPTHKVMVFANTKLTCEVVSMHLRNAGVKCEVVHGDKEYRDRQRAVQNFEKGAVNIVVATDVAARGLDFKDVNLVVNYDMPPVIDQYVHRVGRTGRAGRQGRALTFFTESDQRILDDLLRLLKNSNQAPSTALLDLKTQLRRTSQRFSTQSRSYRNNKY